MAADEFIARRMRGVVRKRNNVTVRGAGRTPIVFAHGLGCSQEMWQTVAEEFESEHHVVLFDHVGSGRSDKRAYDPVKYATVDGYADDVLDIARLFDEPVVFVGHSVGASIGALAAVRAPERFAGLVMLGPSACYVNDGDYVGGFEREDIEKLLALLSADLNGWAALFAPIIMGVAEEPAFAKTLETSFCAMDPGIAIDFARATFNADIRAALPHVKTPSLILQCTNDAVAPISAGRFVHEAIAGSTYVELVAEGHCPHVSAPAETAVHIARFVSQLAVAA